MGGVMKKRKKGFFNPVIRNPDLAIRCHEDGEKENKKDHPVRKKEIKNDTDLFLDATADVKPLSGKDVDVFIHAPKNPFPVHPPPDDELEGLMHLQDLKAP